ncbi:putative reverse transcriptase domain-containing protein, partial [Tanacetum coccineum]
GTMMFSGSIHVDDFVAHIIKMGIPSESYINTLITSSISNIHLNPFHNKRKDNKYQRRMQTTNTAASIKATTANIGASAKTIMEKTKATLQEKNIDNFLTGVKPYYGSTSVRGGIHGRFALDTTSVRQAANIGVKASHVAATIVANSKRLSCDIGNPHLPWGNSSKKVPHQTQFLRKEFVLLVAARLAGLAWIMGHVPCPILMCWDVIKWSHGLVSDGHAAPSGWFAIHGLCIDDSLSINARRRAVSFVFFRLWLDIRLLSYSTVHNPWSSLIPLSRGSFDMIMGMDWLSKRKFMIVCHEKVVRVPLEGDEILRVHGERTLGAAKALMNAKLDKTKLSDISVRLRRCKNCLNNIKGCKTKVSFDLVIFCKDHQCRLLRRGAWSLFEVSVEITEEGEVKWRVKLRRARAMSMTTQSSVKDKILVTSSKASKECEIRYHPGKANEVLGNPGEAGIRRYYNLGKICIGVYVDYVGVGTQSIERDRLIGIGVVLDNSFRSVLSDPGNWIIEI